MIGYIHYPTWLKPEIIPGLPIRWYGLMYLAAFAVAYFLFKYQIKKRELDIKDDDIINFFFWGILGLLLGARILATTLYDPTGRYLQQPWLIFWPFDEQFRFIGLQGMRYHGGLIGSITAVLIYCGVKKMNFLRWADLIIAGIPLGYTFGRLGNFINGELWGRVTTASWGMIFPHAPRFSASREWVRETAKEAGINITSSDQMVNLPRHPSQLYEAFFEGIFIWAILWFVFRKRSPFKGFMLSVYLISYGAVRFVIEYFREPDMGIGFPLKFGVQDNPIYRLITPWNFTTGQILCVLMIAAGILGLFIFKALDARQREKASHDAASKIKGRKLRQKIK